jgi:16S rRNA processing protein RimM
LSDASKKEPLLLGKIAATHGIKGQLRVTVFSGEFGTVQSLDSVMLKGADGVMKEFHISSAVVHGKRLLITFKGFEDINLALSLVGQELYANREKLPALAESEYYWCDLLGLKVETDSGDLLGRVTDIIATGSNDVYVVKGNGREYMIPALEDVVLLIDLKEGIMKVSPPEGLLDL